MQPNDIDDNLPQLPLPKKRTDPDEKRGQNDNAAADLIRRKLANIYGIAPQASKELEEISEATKPLSKHQKFIEELHKQGKSSSEVQTAWNAYYESLPDNEKNQVWQEFYDANQQKKGTQEHHHISHYHPEDEEHTDIQPDESDKKKEPIEQKEIKHKFDTETMVSPSETKVFHAEEISEQKEKIVRKASRPRHGAVYRTLHSIGFGLGMGLIVVVIFLFGFFNDRFIAPFITPSRSASAESLIINPDQPVGPNPLVIIPKINVEIPVIYGLPANTTEDTIENNLENGVVHYPTTALPGQLGNGAIFGHSSNNILNPGKYKFAFVLLHTLQVGDTFTLNYNGTAYVYQIFKREIVPPTDVSVLDNIDGHPATFSLITCDPPGTSINRLVVVGDQISPSPSTDVASSTNQNNAPKPSILPSNSPSLWSRILNFL
jgi:sortase A